MYRSPYNRYAGLYPSPSSLALYYSNPYYPSYYNPYYSIYDSSLINSYYAPNPYPYYLNPYFY